MTIKEINESVEEASALKSIASAYTEISALRLKRIRQQVLRTRAFFIEILNIYAMLRHIPMHRKIVKPSEKKASIILTSNNRFYGHIESGVIQFFLSYKDPGDLYVIGKSGKESLSALNFKFKSIIFKDDIPGAEEIVNLANMVRNYQSVLVYYARFKSVLIQVPVAVDITQTQVQAVEQSQRIDEAYIFEPEVPKILNFFDAQLKQVLIEQTFLETELARTSSKLISMDNAQNNADEFLEKQRIFLSQAKRSLQNTRILETITSMIQNKNL
ncbi:hypothetical protein A3F00_01990 [Candidatus Daviesbacteria bacterium RIFCSPHIGHO2_12_FULL_37_11]|uniref:ATP synthase F1 subunit gamma n=1 Tax=Candidatus Daviesbacteria bacterium RIFCSPHIGHO2_12_FULL_37_11 TaxID=1797777 RepID=A0A1F5KDM8_9BACT|nr:MAG: hypothetical protein A2769_04085 [Candidatus Daviesbacteria bacterium RIFCSPHIGHO2_01_FULL_37_27]OGE38959.1 MAG: hypothetical protein A3F00_01990 [Candidatus Daviesbacteria bacterium RIFCSPHIGHO2_12_FULL_37_11]OGE46172.1 MAG: hypothetical protein A3B39_02130 [Candidatus Daviesbacteria bacterium RIFCSPLOWO2_01_FULL_37_10]